MLYYQYKQLSAYTGKHIGLPMHDTVVIIYNMLCIFQEKTICFLENCLVPGTVETGQCPLTRSIYMAPMQKGTQQENSDVDICFFSQAFESRRNLDILTELFYLKIKYDKDILIEPYAFPVSELYSDNPFVKEILRTGREITWRVICELNRFMR